MNNLASYLVANAYSAASPAFNAISSGCYVNGQSVPCGQFAGFGIGFFIVWLAVILLMVASMWKIFSKAGQPGWAAIIPIYNMIVMLNVVKKPIWWIILLFIPFVNIIIAIMVVNDLAKAFGKGGGFTVGLILLSFIFYPILAFGGSTYIYGNQSQITQ